MGAAEGQSGRGMSWAEPSARENEVLAALAEHLTNAEIAERLSISIRTVESHVSSLLRKLPAEDRRGLIAIARDRGSPGGDSPHVAPGGAEPAVADRWPAPLTSLVGRVAERAALAAALEAHPLVTAVGPGGVGKTRLAHAVLSDVRDRYPDGAFFVDLVPVSDPAMIPAAIASALGIGEHQSRLSADSVLGWLAARRVLLVLDNCEHLIDGVPVLLERLLAGCPRLGVLATSRARLMVPFEWVFPVPGLSITADGGGPGDAVELFFLRAAASGSPLPVAERGRVAAICAALDGGALAIELAAARLPGLGLDGVEAGLGDRLRLLTGARRLDERHRSLRSTLDWSYALLDRVEQAVARRLSVFAAPFSAAAAADLLRDWPPVHHEAVPMILADLAEQSLLTVSTDGGETRYRAQEVVRQYGAERAAEFGEWSEACSRHLSWCLQASAALGAADLVGGRPGPDRQDDAWRSSFDRVADELRSGLRWAAGIASERVRAHRLAARLAELTFARGLPGEAQHRYEQAAALADGDHAVATALARAAGAAESRHFGNDALRLHTAAGEAATRAGDLADAAIEFARAAELIVRARGLMATESRPAEMWALLARARTLAAGDPAAEARTLAAEAFAEDDTDPRAAELAERARRLAHDAGATLAESSALDRLTSVHLAGGRLRAALATALQRTDLLAGLPVAPGAGLEIADALCMAAECAVAVGDLRLGRDLGERVRNLPFHREEGHLATARLIVVTVLAGDWGEAVELAHRFRDGWEQACRPRAGNLSRGVYAAATLFGLLGDHAARADWLDVVDAVASPGRPSDLRFAEFFDALLLLHRGLPDQALARLQVPPEEFRSWHSGLWRPWYAALWAEAAVLVGHPESADRLVRARRLTTENPIAAALVRRSEALAGDRSGLGAAATTLLDHGCRYQWARTLVFSGGADRLAGAAALTEMGATPMPVPALRQAGVP